MEITPPRGTCGVFFEVIDSMDCVFIYHKQILKIVLYFLMSGLAITEGDSESEAIKEGEGKSSGKLGGDSYFYNS